MEGSRTANERRHDCVTPEISVIIPLYQANAYIETCVDSVLGQTFQNFELLLIDDGSTDGGWELCQARYGADPRVRLLRQPHNQGTGMARNRGIEEARGRYLAFLDDDDAALPDMLAKLHDAAERYQADVVTAAGCYDCQDGQRTARIWGLAAAEETCLPEDLGERLTLWCEEKVSWLVWNKLFRRAFITAHHLRFSSMPIADDKLFCFEALCEAGTYVEIPDLVNLYRIHPSASQYHQRDLAYLQRVVSILLQEQEELAQYMQENAWFQAHPDKAEIVRATYARTSQDYFRKELAYRGSDYETPTLQTAIRTAWQQIETQQGSTAWLAGWLYGQMEAWREKALSQQAAPKLRYIFPYHLFHPGERIVLYGAGEVGQAFYHQIQTYGYVELVAIVDRQAGKQVFPMDVQPVAALQELSYDAILIAVRFAHAAEGIRNDLQAMGIDAARIRWDGEAYEEGDFWRRRYLPGMRRREVSSEDFVCDDDGIGGTSI